MEFKVADSVPPHVAQFIKASYELKKLQQAHFEHLAKEHKSEWVRDDESIFIRAGITLLCSAWEAYVEDLARNGIGFLIQNCKCSDDLPLGIRKNIAKEIRQNKNELAPWILAGDNWRNVVSARFESAIVKESNSLNTPKSHKVKAVFADMLDIEDITLCWHWEIYEDSKQVSEIIDHLVEVRGSIAHGRAPNWPAKALRMLWLEAVVTQCAFLMNNDLNERLLAITGKVPWDWVRYNQDWTKFALKVEE